ncbi:AAA family ATPase [Phenylobacterium sp.]|jgi:adenylate kinase family enzyme|uniref:AAA family ATPase n=1 Tax=Phenylobacterium sp. TaxID=1871053 RepID=UPI002F945B07
MRIMVVGTSGSGKTTMARRLSRALGVPHVELDAINWQPGWVALTDGDEAEFVRRVAAATAGEAWVTDGSYTQTWPVLLPRAEAVVWLDYPRRLIMRRVIQRSFVRALTKEELWPDTGNREEFRRWLDREHPIRWAWDTYKARRSSYEARLAQAVAAGARVHRLRHPREEDGLFRTLSGGPAKKAAGANAEIFV